MTYALLVKKMYLDERKIITNETIKDYCKKLHLNYYSAICYLIRRKYVHRILKGIFYLPSIEERKSKRININYLDALAEALKIKKVSNWYFGLETALKFNNLTHEFFTTDFIINDTIFRAKPIMVLGHKVKFIKLKRNLFTFGIIHAKWNFSEPEKTILDVIYLSKYAGLTEEEAKTKVADMIKSCSIEKLKRYAKNYNKTTEQCIKHEESN